MDRTYLPYLMPAVVIGRQNADACSFCTSLPLFRRIATKILPPVTLSPDVVNPSNDADTSEPWRRRLGACFNLEA